MEKTCDKYLIRNWPKDTAGVFTIPPLVPELIIYLFDSKIYFERRFYYQAKFLTYDDHNNHKL